MPGVPIIQPLVNILGTPVMYALAALLAVGGVVLIVLAATGTGGIALVIFGIVAILFAAITAYAAYVDKKLGIS